MGHPVYSHRYTMCDLSQASFENEALHLGVHHFLLFYSVLLSDLMQSGAALTGSDTQSIQTFSLRDCSPTVTLYPTPTHSVLLLVSSDPLLVSFG